MSLGESSFLRLSFFICKMGITSPSDYTGSPGGSDGEESACNAGEAGFSLEKGMATHSRILAWRIPWTEEPGGLPSMGYTCLSGDHSEGSDAY